MGLRTAGTGSRRRRGAALPRLRATALLATAPLVTALLVAGCGGAHATGQGSPEVSQSSGGAGDTSCQAQVAHAGAHGEFAFIRNGGISIVRLPSCRTQVLLASSEARAPLRFSGNGEYLAFGNGAVVSTTGSGSPATMRLPLGRLMFWAWSPRGAQLVGVTRSGGVELWSPHAKPRQLAPSGWGAGGAAFAPGGRLIVTRATEGVNAKRLNELWAFDLDRRSRRLLYRLHGVAALEGMEGIAGFTPNGQDVLFWTDVSGSASIAADGLPLDAIPLNGGRVRTLVPSMLTYDDYIADCGDSLIVTAGMFRESNVGKQLALLSPPTFKAKPLHLSKAQSWTTPSCSENGEIAIAAGPSRHEAHFGLERRAIWLLESARSKPQRLTDPAPNVTDELPRIGPHGRYILFIETETGANGTGPGTLQLLDLGAGAAGGARLVGPIAQLGSSGSYYGHYPWAQLTAWHPE